MRPASLPIAGHGMDAAQTPVQEWRTLAGQCADGNVFFDPDFALPAMAAIGADVRIATWRHPGAGLAALAPVSATRLGRIAPAIRVWSHEYGPLGVPLVDATTIGPAVAGLIDGLVEAGGSLILPDLPADGAVAKAVMHYAAACGRPLAIVDAHQRAALHRSGTETVDCRALLTTRRRKEFGRQMRRLADIGVVSIETARAPDAVRTAFAEFLALEAAGWKGKRGTALAALPDIAAMAREIVSLQAARGGVAIDSIRLNGRPIAMLVSFLSGDTAWTWKIAFDEAYGRFSPGTQIMLEAGTRLLALPGVRRIDSCAAAHHPMIDHLWPGRLAIGTMVVGPVGGGIAYEAGLAAFRLEHRARAILRQLRDRMRG